jgi:hypothetical protein
VRRTHHVTSVRLSRPTSTGTDDEEDDVRALGGRGIDNVDWPAELRVFKTADTTHYVTATATSARACATCGRTFGASDRRSLTVEVRIPDPPPPLPGFQYRQFAAEVHHRSCQPPRLLVVSTIVDQANAAAAPFIGESDMHYLLLAPHGADGDDLPGLVITTSDPIVVRDLDQAEGRSAWICLYLHLGFELVSVDEVAWIAAHAPVTTTVAGSLDGALFTLTSTVDGREVALLQWTRNTDHPAYRAWRQALAAAGALFVLYGEYVQVDAESGTVDLAPGGRLGDIVAGVVRVDMVADARPHEH